MLFKTIKNTTTTITVLAILFVCAAVIVFSIQEHEKLYLETTKSDLAGLSENMASDFVPLLATEPDTFEMSTLLLRLERYDNVKFAVVFDEKWLQQVSYIGRAFDTTGSGIDIEPKDLINRPWGVQVEKNVMKVYL